MSYTCPKCGLLSADEAARCDCGYDFLTKTVRSSYLAADTVRKHGGAEQFAEEMGRGNIRTGAIALAVAAFVGGLSYIQSGRLSVFGGAVAYGAVFLYRGLRQRRLLGKRRSSKQSRTKLP